MHVLKKREKENKKAIKIIKINKKYSTVYSVFKKTNDQTVSSSACI